MNTLLLIGITIFLGIVSGKLFQHFKIPQVVGYILLGVLIGKSFLHLFDESVVESFQPIVNFTLGVIGFTIGAELKGEIFKKYGASIYTILFSQGLLTFLLVAGGVTLLTQQLYLGLLLGAVATATDPASTKSVLWEYKTKGPLTTTLTSIVALDDALALIIYGLASVFARSMITKETFTLSHSIGVPVFEIFKSILLGLITGFIVIKAINKIKEKEIAFASIIGAVAFVVGLSMYLRLDLILSSMAMGMTLCNVVPQKCEKFFGEIKDMSTPLYILFFIVVGAQLDVHIFLQLSVFGIIAVFLIARIVGKVYGGKFGGLIAKARKEVTHYIGYCLLPQGGVAMGLALSISHNLLYLGDEGKAIGLLIINVVAATTFIVQLIGPPLVKMAVIKADEVNRDVTKDDIIETYKVADVMQTDIPLIPERATLNEIIEQIKDKESYHCPVVDTQNRLAGVISLNDLKEAILHDEIRDVIRAEDMANTTHDLIAQDQPLSDAIEIFDQKPAEYLPVVKNHGSLEVVGILEHKNLKETINRKLLEQRGGEQ